METLKSGRIDMSNNIRILRETSMRAQGGRCNYCSQPMWSGDPEPFRRKYGLKSRKSRLFQCTAEHLRARSEGGRNEAGNIVAACLFCNQTRHEANSPLEPRAYGAKIRQRLSKGRWNRLPPARDPFGHQAGRQKKPRAGGASDTPKSGNEQIQLELALRRAE